MRTEPSAANDYGLTHHAAVIEVPVRVGSGDGADHYDMPVAVMWRHWPANEYGHGPTIDVIAAVAQDGRDYDEHWTRRSLLDVVLDHIAIDDAAFAHLLDLCVAQVATTAADVNPF